MSHYNSVLSQLLVHIPRHQFQTLVDRYQGDTYVKKLTTWSQFTALMFAQAGGKISLRDIQNAMAAQSTKLYHLGLPSQICRSTLSDANSKRNSLIYQELFYKLLARCRSITPAHKFHFTNPLITLDSTLIELCLSMFPWSKFNKVKGAIKLHYQFDHAGQIPTFLTVTERRGRNYCHDLRVAQKYLNPIPDSIYCFDRGYHSFGLFRRIHEAGAFFVTRPRKNIRFHVAGQQKRDEAHGVLTDRPIKLKGHYSPKAYPYRLRLVRFYDAETQRTFEFLTNNTRLPALTIAQIYKARWQIEAFFKWIKQNLQLKTFLGTSRNAVLTQIWIAMCYYLLLAYIKYQTRYQFSLFYLHRIVRETLLERLSLIDLLSLTERRLPRIRDGDPQLCLAL